jgi:hypothetical protein
MERCLMAVPGNPTWTSALTAGDSQVTLHLTADDPADVLYARYRRSGGSDPWSAESVTFSRTGTGDIAVTGLGNGLTYEFSAYAKDGTETSEWTIVLTETPVSPSAVDRGDFYPGAYPMKYGWAHLFMTDPGQFNVNEIFEMRVQQTVVQEWGQGTVYVRVAKVAPGAFQQWLESTLALGTEIPRLWIDKTLDDGKPENPRLQRVERKQENPGALAELTLTYLEVDVPGPHNAVDVDGTAVYRYIETLRRRLRDGEQHWERWETWGISLDENDPEIPVVGDVMEDVPTGTFPVECFQVRQTRRVEPGDGPTETQYGRVLIRSVWQRPRPGPVGYPWPEFP